MMNSILSKIKQDKSQDLKDNIGKDFFSYSYQKKIIKNAALKSAEDQRLVLERYKKLNIKK